MKLTRQDARNLVEFARGDYALPLLVKRGVLSPTPHSTKSAAEVAAYAAKMHASADKIYANRGLTKGPQRHNETVAMRIGQSDALRSKAYGAQNALDKETKRRSFISAVKDRNGDPTLRKEAARLTRRARNPDLRSPSAPYFAARLAPTQFALPDKAILRHYYKKAKKNFRSSAGVDRWSGYGDWDYGGRSNKAPTLFRGSSRPNEAEALLKKGKFQSKWGNTKLTPKDSGNSTFGRSATWSSASLGHASRFAGEGGTILGIRKMPETRRHEPAARMMGNYATNFPIKGPIKDSDLRLVLDRKGGKIVPRPLGALMPGMEHGRMSSAAVAKRKLARAAKANLPAWDGQI